MKSLSYVLMSVLFLVSCEDAEQEEQLIEEFFYTTILEGYHITSIAFAADGTAWIGTFKQGLIKHTPTTTTVYTTANSTFPDTQVINDIAIAGNGDVWIGSDALIRFDGNSFTQYNSTNSAIPEDYIKAIAIDANDQVWFSSSRFEEGGLVKYAAGEWSVYTPQNSDLPVNLIQDVVVDKVGNVWVAASEKVNEAYLIKIANTSWTVYAGEDLGFSPYYWGRLAVTSKNEVCGSLDYTLSSLLNNNGPHLFKHTAESTQQITIENLPRISAFSIDNDDDLWFVGSGKYGFYSGNEWIVEQPSFASSGLFTIETDNTNRMWIGTGNGIVIREEI